MVSTRRPTYTPGSRPGGTGGNGGSGGDDVISASRSIPEPAPQQPQKLKLGSVSGRGKGKKGEQSGASPANVLAFPEPKGKRRKRKVLTAAVTLVAVVAGLLAAAVFSPVLAVDTISVTGTRLLTPAQVQAALEPLRGKPLPQISDEEVGRLLEPLVQVKSASAEARPPSGLAVEVRERVPVALVKQGEQYQLVDVEGVRLAATADPASVSLPVIDGGAGAIGQDLFSATAAVLGALPADVLARLSNASAASVDAVELKLVDGQTIIWGNAGEKELKAKVLEALLKVPADPKNPVKVYDVSVPRHPVTR
ncbi:cell division protein FtsQ/DivIB [Pseudarthrobacter sp. NamB4]|uniref:cell division protein FtsQ/DivIB n=1 Tax=Pseudarthrobacter sp. NamB4 TaxID=2576837 RepID=UPI0010FDB651|nr:cell division protein FtsQ/DivIB [Pseudarthrobacter sp. NamB4]TLM71988.1 FtsQ-type POTRA domain-containing protein [Pseudarthrobacter sp. NamB4]